MREKGCCDDRNDGGHDRDNDDRFSKENSTFDGCLAPMDMSDANLWFALDVHIYLFGTLFFILFLTACYAFIDLIRNKIAKPAFKMSINILVIVFGLMRTLSLFVDAYGMKGRFMSVGALLFADLALPCLTSAFVLVQWTFLELLQIRRLNSALQKPTILVAIIIAHFIFIAAIDFMLFYIGGGVCFLMTICQAVTVLWGLVLTFGFLYTTQKLVQRDQEHRLTLQGIVKSTNEKGNGKTDKTVLNGTATTYLQDGNDTSVKTISSQNKEKVTDRDAIGSVISNTNTDSESALKPGREESSVSIGPLRRLKDTLQSCLSKKSPRKSYLTKVKNVGIFTTVIGIALFAVSIYGIVAIYNPFDGAPKPDPWGWYIFQTLHRILELSFGFTMVYLSMSRRQR